MPSFSVQATTTFDNSVIAILSLNNFQLELVRPVWFTVMLQSNHSQKLDRPAHNGLELRVARGDDTCTPYSKEDFLDYYRPEIGVKIWRDAVLYKDAHGVVRNVLVRIGSNDSWGLAERLSQESHVLAVLLNCDEVSPILDLQGIIGCDVSFRIGVSLLEYLCAYESDWWEATPSMGALDVADRLGLHRLLFAIVRPEVRERWQEGRSHRNSEENSNLADANCIT